MAFTRSRLIVLVAGLLFISMISYYSHEGSHQNDLFSGIWNSFNGDEPPQLPSYGTVVAAGRSDTDLSWMENAAFNESWITYPYNVDELSPGSRLRIPQNKGHEAMVYLTYIIDNYDSLPWMTVFVHGHREAWHQDLPVDVLINKLKRKALARQGYISLRCDWYPSCPAEMRPHAQDSVVWGPGVNRKETEQAIVGNWRLLFPDEVIPETIASPCCAQFAVTRKAIRRRPKIDYERMQQWLLETMIEDDVSGRVFEKLWAFIFTGKAVHCPPPQQCACEFFGDCHEREWPIPPDGLAQLHSWP